MEDDHIRNGQMIDEADAKEKNITPEQMRAKRDKALKKTEKLMAKDAIVWMSDERSASEGEGTGD